MDLIDALAANTTARSVVELSLSRLFRRRHASVHDAIGALHTEVDDAFDYPRRALETPLAQAVATALPAPSARPFWLLAVDGVTVARPHARTLADRGYVHQAECSAAPTTVGHSYSLLVSVPERQPSEPRWTPILSTRRVPSRRRAADVAVEQVWDALVMPDAPWAEQLVVLVADSGYGNAPFLADVGAEPNLVVITRLRSNRVLYQQPKPKAGQRGHPRWYGAAFKLADPSTWRGPDSTCSFQRQTHSGRAYTVTVQGWHGMLMKGAKDFPMHRQPFTLLRIACTGPTGQPFFRQPIWLAVLGARRLEVGLEQCHDAFRQRFDQEHTHRFLRQRLLLDAYQSPDTGHEENWLQLVGLAYNQLYVAREVAQQLPRPWEKARPATAPVTPTMVQRDLDRILAEIGTPAAAPKPRGKSPGRPLGYSPGLRPVHSVVYKGRGDAHRARAPAA